MSWLAGGSGAAGTGCRAGARAVRILPPVTAIQPTGGPAGAAAVLDESAQAASVLIKPMLKPRMSGWIKGEAAVRAFLRDLAGTRGHAGWPAAGCSHRCFPL